MLKNGKVAGRPRPPLSERVMWWLSAGRVIDGLWVGTYFQANGARVTDRVAQALALIRSHDRVRYQGLSRDLDRVWVRLLTTGVAQFDPAWRACLLDERFVLAEDTDVAHIAAAIVHEATHARLWHLGFGYDEAIRERVEAACLRREVAFARKLPDGQAVSRWANDALAMTPAYWTNEAATERDRAGALAVLDHLGHGRLGRWLQAVRR